MPKPIVERIAVQPAKPAMDANIRPLYAIEKASWIWHPQAHVGQQAVVLFRNRFTLPQAEEFIIHVSADQRYELSLDGELISFGPDRSDLAHWSFASYRIRLAPGPHVLEATVAWIGDHAPAAQMSHRGGFILACEGGMADTLDTGRGDWQVREIKGWSFTPGPDPNFVGSQQTLDGEALFGTPPEFVKPAVVYPPVPVKPDGIMRAGWRLYPSCLPEQRRALVNAGVLRAVIHGELAADRPVTAADCSRAAASPEWSALLAGKGGATVPAHTTLSVLADLQDYQTAYPQLKLSGGRGGKVTVAWAEALRQAGPDGKPDYGKGQRDEVMNKFFDGIADHFHNDGGAGRDYRTWWWRSGRYVMLTIRTGDEPLTVDRFDLLETRYPLEDEGRFVSSDPGLDATQPLLVRGIQMCAHETYMDCPYYEQLMYVGDTRLEMLTTYLMTPDPRLPKRGIELFDWSRSTWGLVAEQYPGRIDQLSPTFSLIWISMLRDFAWWRDDPSFVRERLTGMRGVLEHFRAMIGPSGLLERVPGWPFVDWVHGWEMGNAPDGVMGISSINNLFLVQALRHAAELEDAFGDPVMAGRNRKLAQSISAEIVRRFWVPERSLLADDEKHRHFSEHAQCLALLNGVLDPAKETACFDSLVSAGDLNRSTIYFSFYLFETFKRHNRGDLIVSRMDFWKDLLRMGLKTPVERPEPTRSDCHAWGSHPLFHMRASLFGLRPASPGFEEVEIAPSPGPLTHLEIRAPHPRGWIEGRLEFKDGTCRGEITLPAGVNGTLRWKDHTSRLAPGKNTIIP